MAEFQDRDEESTFANFYRPMSESELQDLLTDWHSLVPDARVALVEEFRVRGIPFVEPEIPADALRPEYRDLITLRRYRDLSEAIVARGVLESAGIFCFLKDENLVRLEWQISNFIGGIRLQVGALDVEGAEAILQESIPNTIEFIDQPDFHQPRCPRCDSINISYERHGRRGALAFLYLFSLPVPRGGASWTCQNCDLHWADDESSQAISSPDKTSP
jgi:hypothetical protein